MAAMWVFGYGSLMWDPGFPVAAARLARLPGYHRSFCMRSIHHRGTPQAPGLVLALDAAPGAVCDGLALAVAPGAEAATLDYLRARELISSAYLETRQTVHLGGAAPGQGEPRLETRFETKVEAHVEAVTFVIDPDHVQYCGALPLEEQADIIAHAHGDRGPNRDYLWNTAAHLRQLGIADPDLCWLAERVRSLAPLPAPVTPS